MLGLGELVERSSVLLATLSMSGTVPNETAVGHKMTLAGYGSMLEVNCRLIRADHKAIRSWLGRGQHKTHLRAVSEVEGPEGRTSP